MNPTECPPIPTVPHEEHESVPSSDDPLFAPHYDDLEWLLVALYG